MIMTVNALVDKRDTFAKIAAGPFPSLWRPSMSTQCCLDRSASHFTAWKREP
jgi:hypothetical protein